VRQGLARRTSRTRGVGVRRTGGSTGKAPLSVVMLPPDGVVCADNAEFMRGLPDACCDMICIDPPFFTGRRQTGSVGRHAVADQWPGGMGAYLEFLRPRLVEMRRLLNESGTIFVHLDWHAVHYVKVAMDELFGYENFLNEIVWWYRTGGVSRQWLGRKHDTILSYARRRGRHIFHVLREGTFRTDGLKYDGDGRPYKSTKAGRLYFHSEGPAMTDVWELPFLSTVATERTGYPTQKPLALVRRLIQCSTDPGEMVADFFCGSGTTLVAAAELGRQYIGCDINPGAVEITRQRLAELARR
jgi:site-specific DNA-methyltransferase (adenine-specific)